MLYNRKIRMWSLGDAIKADTMHAEALRLKSSTHPKHSLTMLDLHHDNDSTLLLRQRSLRRAPNIQHSPQVIAHAPISSSPPPLSTPTHNHNHTPPPRKKPAFTLASTMTDAFRRFQAFRHARSSSSSSSSSGTKTPVPAYHKRKHPHARSHSTQTTAESPSQTQTSMIQSSSSAPVA